MSGSTAGVPERVQTPAGGREVPVGVLEEGLRACLGRAARVARVEGKPFATSTHPAGRLQVTFDSGERLPVIYKRPQPGRNEYGNEQEIEVYRRLLAGGRFGAPLLYASVHDAARGDYWLFLEDVGECDLGQCDGEDWAAAARWLASMHGAYLGREDELRALNCLGEHGADYYHALAATVRCYLSQAGADQALPCFDALMARFGPVAAYLARQPRTLVHGDIIPNNLLVQPGPRIRPIDWESAAIGLPAWDLARLLDGWGSDRPAFVAAYWAELAKHTDRLPDRQAFERAFRLCDLLNVLWHLSRDARACRDAALVSRSLRKIGNFFTRLEGEADS
jgi:Phosphotransferase enzyme family